MSKEIQPIDRPEKLGNPVMKFGSDAVAEVTRNLDYEYIALVPGASYRGFHDSIVNYLGNASPQMVVCLHEEHCVAIAHGYASVTNKPMAVALHSNVGLMHATMAIYNAWCNRMPMLIFGANGPIDANKRRPWIEWIHTTKDQASMIRDYIKWDDEPQSAQAAVESVLRANQITRTPPFGPVYVCLDVDMQESEIQGEISIPPVDRFQAAAPPAASDETLDTIITALRAAKFPIMLTGRVSRDQAAWDNRVALAEALGLVVMSSLHNAAAFPTEHPLHVLPASGERAAEIDSALIKQADVLFSLDWLDVAGYLEMCLGEKQTQKPIDKKIIQCSLETYIANGWVMDYQALPATDINVLSDPDALVAQLLKRLEVQGIEKKQPPADMPVHWNAAPGDYDKSASGDPMSRREMAEVVAEFSKTRDVTLGKAPIGWSGAACHFAEPLDYLGKDGGGGVGAGPGMAVGAALALKDSGRLMIAVMGDGDYLMGVNALWTASHMELPMIIVVANNRSYFNDELHQERVAIARDRPVENRWIGQRLDEPTPDIVGFGKAQGFDGEGPISDVDEFMKALERGAKIIENGGRYVIDVSSVGY
jgi:thiamine pyrophosphate-dependent acetolactate synthase large subunit-like protein